MPSDTDNCPTTFGITQITEADTTKSHEWKKQVPIKDAYTWHCKYGLTTSDKIDAPKDDDT